MARHLTEVVRLLELELHALPKRVDDLHPIAAGATLRRLVGHVPLQGFEGASAEPLVAISGRCIGLFGAEVAVHTTRQWAQRNAGSAVKVVVTLDVVNTLNTVDRAALRQVRLHLLGLAPWAAVL